MVAASAGNHAQGVAVAAGLLNTSATVFMPLGAPLPKVAATKGYGAKVQLVGTTVDESLVAAAEYAAETGAIFIHPFDHKDVIAGQGTVALEILEQVPDVKTIVAGIGGGGLISGHRGGSQGPQAGHPDRRRTGGRGRLDGRFARRRAGRCGSSGSPRSPTVSPSGVPATSRSPTSTRWSTTSSR